LGISIFGKKIAKKEKATTIFNASILNFNIMLLGWDGRLIIKLRNEK
jgi:hypothetical protein